MGLRIPWRVLGPLSSGVLLAAATPPAPSPLLPFVALVPLAAYLMGTQTETRAALSAIHAGMLVGAVQHGWGLRWLPFTMTSVAGPTAGWLTFAAVLAVLSVASGAATWATHRLLTGRHPLPIALALPITWTALEWGLAHLPFGLAFPWAPLGLGLARWPQALGLAEVIGVGGVTAWLACVNGLLAGAFDRTSASARARGAGPMFVPGVAALLVAVLPVTWGFARASVLGDEIATPAVGRVTAVALAVPPGAADLEWTSTAVDATGRALDGLAEGVTDLVVLPEMIVAVDPVSPGGASQVGRLRDWAAHLGAPLLVGTLSVEDGRSYNSAVLLSGRGIGKFRADKRHLVPGVERATVVRAPWLAPVGSGGYAPGDGWPVAGAGTLRVGVLLCFEVAFSADARALVRNGANALAALTSDAWFGGGPGARGAGIAQQMAHLTVRVVETRVGAVRASNGGPAVILGPAGREEGRAAPGLVAGIVRTAPHQTLFVRTGDLAGPLAALSLLLLMTSKCRTHLTNWKT